MTPRQKDNDDDAFEPKQEKDPGVSSLLLPPDHTSIICHTPDDGAPFVICQSKEPFVNPTTDNDTNLTIQERNETTLNLDLGLKNLLGPRSSPKMKWLLFLIACVDKVAFEWWESLFFNVWAKVVPLRVKRRLTFTAWSWYSKLHFLLLGRRTTGLHPSQSWEYHALTTIVWWCRFFPITPRRMRFSLSQLSSCTPHVVNEAFVEKIEEEQQETLPAAQSSHHDDGAPHYHQHSTVRGLLLRNPKHRCSSSSSESSSSSSILFWIYGGAYLGGDAAGNAPAADYVGQTSAGIFSHTFVPQFRLAPEATMDEVLWDIVLSYRWACRSFPQSRITVAGVSSGGALAVRLMQCIAEFARNDDEFVLPHLLPLLPDCRMPQGAALIGPYVDYTREAEHHPTFRHNARLDLIVTEAVQEGGLPYLGPFCNKGRKEQSPVHRNLDGLPPLLVLISEQEAVYDMAMELVNKARTAEVEVTVGVWKYMCHVFTVLYGFIPEGRQSMQVLCEWIVKNNNQISSSSSSSS